MVSDLKSLIVACDYCYYYYYYYVCAKKNMLRRAACRLAWWYDKAVGSVCAILFCETSYWSKHYEKFSLHVTQNALLYI